MEKMEETIRAMQKKMADLQQQQGDNTMGARDLIGLMETSNSNLHKNICTAKKSKQEMLKIQTTENGDWHMSVEASIPWAESTDVFEII